jgi:hypothetical protein
LRWIRHPELPDLHKIVDDLPGLPQSSLIMQRFTSRGIIQIFITTPRIEQQDPVLGQNGTLFNQYCQGLPGSTAFRR